jgi:hypothetical protein
LGGAVIERALNDHIHGWLDVRQWNNQRSAEIERARALPIGALWWGLSHLIHWLPDLGKVAFLLAWLPALIVYP